MNSLRLTGLIGAAALAVLCVSPAAQSASTPRDGQHDFDFDLGNWKSHSSRLLHPLSGST